MANPSRKPRLEEPLEQGYDPAYVSAKVLKQHAQRTPFARFSLGQRYAELEMGLHVHARIRRIEHELEAAYYCAVFERADPGVTRGELPMGGVPKRALDGRIYETKTAVLVDDVQGVDDSERIVGLPSVVRLKPLDLCQHFWSDFGKVAWVRGLPFRRVIEEWELRLLRHQLFGVDDSVGGVVERGTEGMGTFASEARPRLVRRVLNDLSSPEEVPIPLPRVCLSEHSVRVSFEETGPLLGELAEVFFCALELRPRAAEGISTHRGAA